MIAPFRLRSGVVELGAGYEEMTQSKNSTSSARTHTWSRIFRSLVALSGWLPIPCIFRSLFALSGWLPIPRAPWWSETGLLPASSSDLSFIQSASWKSPHRCVCKMKNTYAQRFRSPICKSIVTSPIDRSQVKILFQRKNYYSIS